MKHDAEKIIRDPKFKDKLIKESKMYRDQLCTKNSKKIVRINNDMMEMIMLMTIYRLFGQKEVKQRFIKLNKRIQKNKGVKVQDGKCTIKTVDRRASCRERV